MGILDRLEKKRDKLRADLNLKKEAKKDGGSEISVLLAPKNPNGEKRIKTFQPKNRYLKSYTVNENGIGEAVFSLPVGVPEVMKQMMAKKIKAQIDEVAKDDIDASIFVGT